MQSIFISYRRDDSEGQAGRLYDDLAARFGAHRVFMDVAGISAGSKFKQVIEDRVAECAVLLVVIGKRWLDAKDAAGNRRLDNPDDFVRLEAVSALKRDSITVVPVLIGGATMPEAKDLPPELAKLSEFNAAQLSHQRWAADIEALVADLRKVLPPEEDDDAPPPTPRMLAETSRRQRRMPMALVVGGAALAVAVSAGGWVAYDQFSPLRKAEREALLLDIEARKAEALAKLEAARRLEAEEKSRQAQIAADQKRAEAQEAAASAAAAQLAAEAANRKLAAASADEKARAEAEAVKLAQAQEQAKKEADAKAAAAEQERVAAERANKAAAEKAQTYQVAQADLARTAALVSAANQKIARAGGTKFVQEVAVTAGKALDAITAAPPAGKVERRWRLQITCGRPIAVAGTATFSIQPSGEGVIVGVRFAGSGDGYDALIQGRASFPKPQAVYAVPTIGEWKGEKVFKTTQTFDVFTRDGAFADAKMRDLRNECRGGL